MQTRAFFLTAALLTALSAAPTLAQDAPVAAPAVTDAPAAVPDAAGVTLRYKFTPGQTRTYKFSMDSDGMLTGGPNGQGFPIQQHMDAILRQTVKDVRASDGAATVQVGYDTLTMTMNGQALPAQNTDAMKQVGTLVMLPTGKILSFTSANTAGAGPFGNMNNMFQNMNTSTFPDGPVKADDKWDGTMALAAMGLKATASNTVVSVDTHTAHYTTVLKGTMDSGAAPPTSNAPALPLTIAGTLDGASDQTFDVAAGALTTQTGTVNLDLTMSPKAAQGAAAPAMGPMKLKMKVTTHMDYQSDTAKPAAAP